MMHRHGETLVFEGTKQRDVGTNAMGCGDKCDGMWGRNGAIRGISL